MSAFEFLGTGTVELSPRNAIEARTLIGAKSCSSSSREVLLLGGRKLLEGESTIGAFDFEVKTLKSTKTKEIHRCQEHPFLLGPNSLDFEENYKTIEMCLFSS